MKKLIFWCLFGYAFAQWQYGEYPRYGYVYGDPNQLGFGYNPYKLSESTQKVQPRQTIANYYQPGSILNPLNLARPLSPTNTPNVKVVDYNSLDLASRRQLSQANGQYVAKSVPQSIPTINRFQTSQRQIAHPGLQNPFSINSNNPIQQQQRINQQIQMNEQRQKQLKIQQQFQRQMIEKVNKQTLQEPNPPSSNQKSPIINYPVRGFVIDKPQNQQRNAFQNSMPRFGSSYLPSGAGRVEELRGSLGGSKPIMDWIQAKTPG